MHYVYVLKSVRDDDLYIGCTHDLERRVEAHNLGLVRSTKGRRPLRLIYKEEYKDKYSAYKMERFYKTAKGKKALKSKFTF